jgi:hypothetical protein
MRSLLDIAWFAGIVEGEGHLHFYSAPNMGGKLYAELTVIMTDEDVIRRCASLLGVNVFSPRKKSSLHKQSFRCRARGHKVLGWMMTIYPFMGERRKSKILHIVNTLRNTVEAAPPEMVVTATETIRLSSAETGDRIEGATSSS